MTATAPRSDNTLAKALTDVLTHAHLADGNRSLAIDLAAHPAMLARDAALEERGARRGRNEVAAAIEAALPKWGHFATPDLQCLPCAVRAAVAAAGASDLAAIRAEAIREWVNGWPCKPGDGSFLGDVARDGLERADRL